MGESSPQPDGGLYQDGLSPTAANVFPQSCTENPVRDFELPDLPLGQVFPGASGRGGSPKAMALSPCTGPAGEIMEPNASSPFLYNSLWFSKRYTTVSLSSWQLQYLPEINFNANHT